MATMQRIVVALMMSSLAAVALVAQQAPATPPQEPPPVTFRIEVNYVEIDAIVTDAQGQVVSNLTADDFELVDDGKPQKITAFSVVNLPIERGERPLFASTPIEPDVQTNDGGEGRIYLIVLDDLHTHPLRAVRVKAALHRFFEQNFGVNDLAAIVYTGGRSRDSQDFTNSTRLLLASVDKFTGRKERSATLERIDSARPDPSTGNVGPGDDPFEQERALHARNVMSTVRRLSEFMASVRGRRKAMLLISEGIDYDINQAVGVTGSTAASITLDTQDAIAAATRGNVAIYAIDPRGLTTGTEDLIEASSTFEDQGVGEVSARAELRLSQDSLRVLAASTGGFAAINQNDFNNAFDRIVRENSTYYVLGYYPTNDKRDGRFRKVQVRTKKPGLMVRSRNGYYAARGRANAPKPGPSKALNVAIDEALGSPLPMPGVPIRVFAAAYKGPAPNAAVAIAIEIDASRFDFVEKAGTWNERLEVISTATDTNGKVFPGDRQTINLALKPATYDRVKAAGLRLLTQTDLPPGRYQLRVAAGNVNGKAGSVIYDLDVPDYFKTPLTMSGIALTSASAAEVMTVRPKDPLKDLLPGPATASREFRTGDTIALFGEVYETQRGGPAHMVDIRTELKAEGGKTVRTFAEQRSSSELQGSTGGYGFMSRIPLSDIAPGLYVIHVEAQSRAGDQPKVSRDILIRVK
jgi:VWFA-related protein